MNALQKKENQLQELSRRLLGSAHDAPGQSKAGWIHIPSMKLLKPTETCNLLESRMLPMLKCFAEKASLKGKGLLIKKKKWEKCFFPPSAFGIV